MTHVDVTYVTYIRYACSDIVFRASIPVSIPVLPGYRVTEKGLTNRLQQSGRQYQQLWVCVVFVFQKRQRQQNW